MFFIIAGMALVTFATRFAAVALLGQKKMPAGLERWLRHIPTGILTALIAPCPSSAEGICGLFFAKPLSFGRARGSGRRMEEPEYYRYTAIGHGDNVSSPANGLKK